MRTTKLYIKPEAVIFEVELEGIVAVSSGSQDVNVSETLHEGGSSRSKRQFWGE